jgi:hypothetical protein
MDENGIEVILIFRIAVMKNTAYRIHVKTTIDLADDLAISLKKRTAREGISMRTAVHQALRMWLKNQPESHGPMEISADIGLMTGQGLSPEAASRSWEELRALSYDQTA